MPPTQPHRKTVKHFDVLGHLHEITFSCYARKQLLTDDAWRGMLAKSIDSASHSEGFELIAFVFMPEHVHLLVIPGNANSKISRWLARVKQPFPKQIKEILEASHSPLLSAHTVRERPGKFCFRFWQEGSGFDRNLYSPQAVEASMDYIHMNPVRRGLCKTAVEWKWSSARFYLEGANHSDLPRLFRLPSDFFTTGGVQVAPSGH
jgi:putative transposase